jgi:hypothetical protein
MKSSPKQRVAMSAVIFAIAATAFGASAQTAAESPQFENFEHQLTAGSSVPSYTPSEHPGIAAQRARPESRQFEFFESQEGLSSVPVYDPAEHPDAAPAPRSAHQTPSVFDDPLNTASPGA